MKKQVKRWILSILLAGGIPLLPSCSVADGLEGAGRGWHTVTRITWGPCIIALFRLSREQGGAIGLANIAGRGGVRLALGLKPSVLPYGWRDAKGTRAQMACFDWGMPMRP